MTYHTYAPTVSLLRMPAGFYYCQSVCIHGATAVTVDVDTAPTIKV